MRLTLATEYPNGALPGEAMSALATLVREAVGDELTINLFLEVKQCLCGIGDGSDVHFDGGAVFGASLSQHASEFELAAIPRGTGRSDSDQDARRYRRIFEDCLKREGFRLIAAVPMPSTGVWSSREIDSEATLAAMRIRTYDSLSSRVFSSMGCTAVRMPFAGLPAALEGGQLDAVLSSGDGEAGAALSRYFGHYLPLAYSTPLCFLIVRESSFSAMSWRAQRALKRAGREVQFRYFSCQQAREESNLRAIQERGVRVGCSLPRHAMALLERTMELVRRRLIAEYALADVLVPIV